MEQFAYCLIFSFINVIRLCFDGKRVVIFRCNEIRNIDLKGKKYWRVVVSWEFNGYIGASFGIEFIQK